MDTMTVMCEAAYLEGYVPKQLPFIPELANTVEKSTDYLFKFAQGAMAQACADNDPDAGVEAMRRICTYMFAKGIEAVFLWADSSDGTIDIVFDPMDALNLNIKTDLSDARQRIVLLNMFKGTKLFEAHREFVFEELTTPPGHAEGWCDEEMKKAIYWSMQLGIAYSLAQGFQAG